MCLTCLHLGEIAPGVREPIVYVRLLETHTLYSPLQLVAAETVRQVDVDEVAPEVVHIGFIYTHLLVIMTE